MSEEERLQLENECLMKYSKAQMIQKYIDELEESSKLSELWCKSQEQNKKQKEVIDKAIEINKQIKEFVYNEMVDRCVPGSTELYELVKEELKILKGGNNGQ